jgi:hypothetical protein
MTRPVIAILVTSAVCLIAAGGAFARGLSRPACPGPALPPGISGTTCPTAAAGTERPALSPVSIGKKLVGKVVGTIGGAAGTVVGAGAKAVATVGLTAIAAWVAAGDRAALQETIKLIGASTSPQLLSPWFSSAYWRVAGVSALLTLPFLFAAAIQALVRSDLALLGRAAFGYLPAGMLAVGIAAPLTMLLLSASDEMSNIVSSASGHAGETFLGHASTLASGLSAAVGSPFLAFAVGSFTVAGSIVLWLELMVRAAAVYVIVLMLPLFFAALVWPARRMWAIRSVELLVALVLSKFVIVAVLALGGSALAHASGSGPTAFLAGLALVLMAAMAPWAMLRLLPLHEVASAAAGGLRAAPVQPMLTATQNAHDLAGWSDHHARALAGRARARGGDDETSAAVGPPRLPAGQDPTEPAPADSAASGPSRDAGDGATQAAEAVIASGGHLSAPSLAGMRDGWRQDWDVKLDKELSPVADVSPPASDQPPTPGADPSPAPEAEPPAEVVPPPPSEPPLLPPDPALEQP